MTETPEPQGPTTEADQQAWADIYSRWRYGYRLDMWDDAKRRIVTMEAHELLGPKWPEARAAAPPDNGSRATDDPRERQHDERDGGDRHWWRCVPIQTAREWEAAAAPPDIDVERLRKTAQAVVLAARRMTPEIGALNAALAASPDATRREPE